MGWMGLIGGWGDRATVDGATQLRLRSRRPRDLAIYLQLNRQADFDDLHGRQLVVIRGLTSVSAEEAVQMFLPVPHFGIAAGDDHFPIKIVGRFGGLER